MAVDASSSQWLESIDAVYALFEDEALRAQYPDLAAKVQKAVKLCEEAFNDVGIPKCALSFNGGKDCTVIVHILAAVLRRLAGLSVPRSKAASSASPPAASSSSSSPSSSAQPLPPIPTVYIACDSPFAKLEDFIRDSQRRYNLDLYTVTGGMKEGLIEYFAGGGEAGVPEAGRKEKGGAEAAGSPSRRQRDVKAIFIGTRRTDPNGESLQDRQWTDPSWPQVERIHVILDWDYADVWAFLRCPALGVRGEEGVPYCELYDEGYTSLGSTYNTFPNPLLRRGKDGEGEGEAVQPSFKPAWQLEDGSAERAGRGDKPRGEKAS